MKVEVAVLATQYGLCGRKPTPKNKKNQETEFRSCLKVEVAVSVAVKQH